MDKPTPTPKLLEEYSASLLVDPTEALYNHVAYNLLNLGYTFLPNVGWVNPNYNGEITQGKERGFFGKIRDSIYDWANSNSDLEFIQNLKNNTRHHLWSWDRGQTVPLGLGKIKQIKYVNNQTKGDLFVNRKNWQSARSSIRKAAERVFKESKIPFKCAVCGYNKHIEIAHIRAVSDFDDSTKISEINSIDNLIALCPNHHWEYDNGILKL